MKRQDFDDQFIIEITDRNGVTRECLLFDEHMYRQKKVKIPVQYYSTVNIEFLSPPTVDEVRASQQGTRHIDGTGREIVQNAQVRQDTARNYRAVQIDDSPFFTQATHDKVDRKNHSTRMAFPLVEAGMTREQMQGIINSHEDAKIVEILSERPIINMKQFSAINAQLTDLDTICYGVPRVVDEYGQNVMDENGRAIEIADADLDAGHRIERRGGQVLRYPANATNADGESIEGQVIKRRVGMVDKEQYRAQILDLSGYFQDYDFRERVVSPITTTNLGRQSFAELSNHARFVQTADQSVHEGHTSSTGSNPSTTELRRQGRLSNAFDGMTTSTSVTTQGRGAGQSAMTINSTGEPIQPGVAVGGDNPESQPDFDPQGDVPRHTTRNAPNMGDNNPRQGGVNPDNPNEIESPRE